MKSYVEQELSRWQRKLCEAQERLRDLSAAAGDVLMFEELPDLAVGDLVEARGRRMVVAMVAKPGDGLVLKIGECVDYNVFPNRKYAVQLVEVRDE